MNTAWVMIAVVLLLLAVEAYSFRSKEDSWAPITHVMRMLPKWAVGLIMFITGVFFGHFYWS